MTPKETILAKLAELHISMTSEFVPYSKSRGAKKDAKTSERTLNWEITILVRDKPILTTEYSAGIAHCPSFKNDVVHLTVDLAIALNAETNTGMAFSTRKPILPDIVNVVYSLMLDSEAINSPSFEAWAQECGYDEDSRKAEKCYQECLKIGLALRAALGDAGLASLSEACQGY